MNAFIGVGSNIRPKENVEKALTALSENVTVLALSTFYWTEPISEKQQASYLNGVWQIDTAYSPKELKFGVLSKIEKILHRHRTKDRYASRTIDLDLILYGDLVLKSQNLIIPDPDIYTRPFIALPLYELNPNLLLPDTNIPISTVKDALSCETLNPDEQFTQKLKQRIHAKTQKLHKYS